MTTPLQALQMTDHLRDILEINPILCESESESR